MDGRVRACVRACTWVCEVYGAVPSYTNHIIVPSSACVVVLVVCLHACMLHFTLSSLAGDIRGAFGRLLGMLAAVGGGVGLWSGCWRGHGWVLNVWGCGAGVGVPIRVCGRVDVGVGW